jgi:hypothetical protein
VEDSLRTTSAGGGSKLITAVCELLPKVAVRVAVWLLVMEGAAVALKEPMVAPAAIAIEPGTVSEVLLLARVTLEPPEGAV